MPSDRPRAARDGTTRMAFTLIRGQRRIDLFYPGVDSAGQIGDLAESGRLQELRGAAAAAAGLAHRDDFALARELLQSLRQLLQRDLLRRRQADDGALPGLAHVEQLQ